MRATGARLRCVRHHPEGARSIRQLCTASLRFCERPGQRVVTRARGPKVLHLHLRLAEHSFDPFCLFLVFRVELPNPVLCLAQRGLERPLPGDVPRHQQRGDGPAGGAPERDGIAHYIPHATVLAHHGVLETFAAPFAHTPDKVADPIAVGGHDQAAVVLTQNLGRTLDTDEGPVRRIHRQQPPVVCNLGETCGLGLDNSPEAPLRAFRHERHPSRLGRRRCRLHRRDSSTRPSASTVATTLPSRAI